MPVLRSNKVSRIRLAGCCFVLFFSLIAIAVQAPAQQPVAREYQIKAVFLFNFTQFIQWPSEAFDSADSPFVIGILGDDPFGMFMDQTVKSEASAGHQVVVERYSSIENIKDCHILFISLDSKQEIRHALNKVKGRPVLTVSDAEDFARTGGMVGFYNEAGRIRFNINVGSVSDSRIIISSKLLRLAEIVPGKND